MIKRIFSKPNRIWEVDFVRGLMILLVVLDHFFYDVASLGMGFESGFGKWLFNLSNDYYAGRYAFLGQMRILVRYRIVMLFALVSGMSSQFSKNNFKRGLLLAAVGLGFSLIVFVIDLLNIAGIGLIWFNIIHVLAVSILFYALVELIYSKCNAPWKKNVFLGVMSLLTLAIIVVGEFFVMFPYEGTEFGAFFFNATGSLWEKISSGDYLSLFPALGWFLLGAAMSKKLYPEKKTLFPSVNTKYVEPICFIGKYTLFVYFGSQIIMFGLVYLFAVII